MKKKNTILKTVTLSSILFASGCLNLNNNKIADKESSNLVSVQEYTGEGFDLPNGEKNDKIAEAKRDEIDKAMKKFFMDTYKTEVEVHNIVGNKDGATVFVESVGEPHFHTFAIVPINGQDQVITDGIWTQEGQVEGSIMSGIYAMIYDKELNELDTYLEKIVSEHPVTGVRDEAIQNTYSTGFTTPYYYITILDEAYDTFYEEYLQNPKTSKEDWKNKASSLKIDPEGYLITIQLFMKEKNQKPDQEILDTIVSDIESLKTLSPGSYGIYLNDNNIATDSADGTKDNTIEKVFPNEIMKP
ncbi:DUF1672 family protein [Fictibacillus sp. 5RED26]|uniref:DUF1672 family protein n=1 Tax=Fictibacillus sp. 5RED26 TaxID=2745876 RepID=UPI0018CEFE7C|nr:DUF1672 family protein [Fictibacillus sp. 5RED26]MBH0156680.1 DUF1672 family protein [Fictibacillus sp. 5RED26]